MELAPPPVDVASQFLIEVTPLVHEALDMLRPGILLLTGTVPPSQEGEARVVLDCDDRRSVPNGTSRIPRFEESFTFLVVVDLPGINSWDRKALDLAHGIKLYLLQHPDFTKYFSSGPGNTIKLYEPIEGTSWLQGAVLAFDCTLKQGSSYPVVAAARPVLEAVDWGIDLRAPEDPAEREDRGIPPTGWIAPRESDGKTEIQVTQTGDDVDAPA